MKTFFTEEEIKEFLHKETETLLADSLIAHATTPHDKPDFTEKFYTVDEMLEISMEYAFNLGKAQGSLSARSEFMEKCFDFFNIGN